MATPNPTPGARRSPRSSKATPASKNLSTDVEDVLKSYRLLTQEALARALPKGGRPRYLYELVADYPSRPGKGLRPALCLSLCKLLGGDVARALPSAVAIEMFHNAFLIHDDVQDQSEFRRGEPTLGAAHGVGIAVNVGNAANLIALRQLTANRDLLGPQLAWRVVRETEEMLRHSLEGQAMELEWIRDNVCDLTEADYYRMCLKKTSYYTCIYPLRLGALIAGHDPERLASLDRYAWYLGAAFQIQDDVLNLAGAYDSYGKEIAGDLWEGKRTLILIHLLRSVDARTRARLAAFCGKTRAERDEEGVRWVLGLLREHGSLQFAQQAAVGLAEAGRKEAEALLASLPDSPDRRFLVALPAYMVARAK